MKISEKVDAEFINRAVFKIVDMLYEKEHMYKIGFLLLSGRDLKLESKIKYIDFLTGKIDGYIIEKKNEKALIYTTLLRKRVNDILKDLKIAENFELNVAQ
ncbi:MAG: hypothetical protein IJP18_10240 [Oscillospiraceae bacterium]|nr:hypothetical protein [Oscillospiraceae bacterium]